MFKKRVKSALKVREIRPPLKPVRFAFSFFLYLNLVVGDHFSVDKSTSNLNMQNLGCEGYALAENLLGRQEGVSFKNPCVQK